MHLRSHAFKGQVERGREAGAAVKKSGEQLRMTEGRWGESGGERAHCRAASQLMVWRLPARQPTTIRRHQTHTHPCASEFHG